MNYLSKISAINRNEPWDFEFLGLQGGGTQFCPLNLAMILLGLLTFWTQKWRWMEDDFAFQLLNWVIFRFKMSIFQVVFHPRWILPDPTPSYQPRHLHEVMERWKPMHKVCLVIAAVFPWANRRCQKKWCVCAVSSDFYPRLFAARFGYSQGQLEGS